MVAEQAKVSRETASHILGGKRADRYKDSTRKRVEDIARALNYRPHRGAQMMKSGRSNIIAIIHFGAGIEAARKINQTLAQQLQKIGYDYLAIDMNWHDGNLDRLIETLIGSRVEGVLISHIQTIFKDEHIEKFYHVGIPVVLVNGETRRHATLVSSDATDAIEAITDHLFTCGHRRVLQIIDRFSHLAEAHRPLNWNQRVTGFQRSCERHGSWTIVGEEEFFAKCLPWPTASPEKLEGIILEQNAEDYAIVDKPVYRLCLRLFSQPSLPDAIICRNDMYAMEAIAAALECGVAIPHDVAITGYDNDRMGTFPAFGFTTAEQDIEGICAKAIHMLLQLLKAPQTPMPETLFIPSRVIIRNAGSRP